MTEKKIPATVPVKVKLRSVETQFTAVGILKEDGWLVEWYN